MVKPEVRHSRKTLQDKNFTGYIYLYLHKERFYEFAGRTLCVTRRVNDLGIRPQLKVVFFVFFCGYFKSFF
jgi:hypothetical protein